MASFKNFCLKWALRLIRPLIRKHSENGRILIVSTTALGDTLWGTAAIENIRRSFPRCTLGVLTSAIGLEVLKHNPFIDHLFLLKEPVVRHAFSLWKQLYRQQFDTVLLFHASQRLVLPLVSLIGASRILGTAGINKGLDHLLTDPLPNERQHEIARRLKLAEKIGAHSSVQTLSFFLQPEERLSKRAPGPCIALHPGSKDPFKRWPAEKFIELGCRLKRAFSCEILVTGSAAERELMANVARSIPGAHLDSPNRSLREFAALLSQMDLLISNDTGPVHLACSLNCPVIGIYSSTDPAICGPYRARKAVAISRGATCDPCLKRKCLRPFCFLQIGVDPVFKAAETVLSEGPL